PIFNILPPRIHILISFPYTTLFRSHAFVTSRLDYCNSLLAGHPAVLLDRLQSILNSAARLYAGVSRRSHVSAILRDDLHWLSIPDRKSTRLNSSHDQISYAVFCLKK